MRLYWLFARPHCASSISCSRRAFLFSSAATSLLTLVSSAMAAASSVCAAWTCAISFVARAVVRAFCLSVVFFFFSVSVAFFVSISCCTCAISPVFAVTISSAYVGVVLRDSYALTLVEPGVVVQRGLQESI